MYYYYINLIIDLFLFWETLEELRTLPPKQAPRIILTDFQLCITLFDLNLSILSL